MSYIRTYISEESIPEWEDSFDKVYIHGDELKNEGVGSALLSFTSVGRSNLDVQVMKFARCIKIDAQDILPSFSMENREAGQDDVSLKGGVMIDVRYNGSTLVQYDPIFRVFIIPDIYHTINQYTSQVRTLCKKLESNLDEYISKSDTSDSRLDVIDGRLRRSSDVAFDGHYDNFGYILSEIREEFERNIKRIRDSETIGFAFRDKMIPKSLAEKGISVYSLDNGVLLASRRVTYTVEAVDSEGLGWLKEIPDEYKVDDSATLVLIMKPRDRFTELDHSIDYVLMNTPHPHRDGGISECWHRLCTGTVLDGGRRIVQDFDDLEEIFDALEEALSIVNVDSPNCKDLGGYNNYPEWDVYMMVKVGEFDE